MTSFLRVTSNKPPLIAVPPMTTATIVVRASSGMAGSTDRAKTPTRNCAVRIPLIRPSTRGPAWPRPSPNERYTAK